jgi:hypothetical protein
VKYRYHYIPSGGNYEAYHCWKRWIVFAPPEVRHTGSSLHRGSEHGCCHENTTAYEIWIQIEFALQFNLTCYMEESQIGDLRFLSMSRTFWKYFSTCGEALALKYSEFPVENFLSIFVQNVGCCSHCFLLIITWLIVSESNERNSRSMSLIGGRGLRFLRVLDSDLSVTKRSLCTAWKISYYPHLLCWTYTLLINLNYASF